MFSVHIPKTGGTTFLSLLHSRFGDLLIQDYELPREEVNRLIGGAADYCVHGHFHADKYADVPNATFVTWMREPIDRLISEYNFWHNYRYPANMVWRRVYLDKMDFVSFAKLRANANMQSRYLAGKPLEEFTFVGVTELFNEGLELFRDTFNLSFDVANVPRLRDSGQFRNVFNRSMLSRKDEAIIREAHSIDYGLYQQALTHFRSACSQTYPSASVADGKAAKPSYSSLTWGGQFLGHGTEASSLGRRDLILARMKAAGIHKILGTYYYGDSWPVNMWDTFRPELVDNLLKTIKDNGYNTVILLIPAGLELLGERRPELLTEFYRDLDYIISRIRAHGLCYIFRIAYGWEGYPVEMHRGLRLFSLVSSTDVQRRYLEILAGLWEKVKDDPLFLMAFTTWEDLISNPLKMAPLCPPERKALLAPEIGYTRSPKGIPDFKDPDFAFYLEHVDDCFVNFMYRIQDVFPPVTLEVRVDHTPAYDAAGNFTPFIHHKQMLEVDTNVLGTYFGTYMMLGPTPRTAEQAMDGLERAHANIRRNAPDSKVFVDQFNFVMKEKAFGQFEPLEVPELKRFLDQSVDWMDKHSIGYATWSFIDYMMDVVSNSAFRLGLEGWTVSKARFEETDAGRRVIMDDGAIVSGTNMKHYSPWMKDGWVIIEADIDPGATLTIDLADDISMTVTAADFSPSNYGQLPRFVREFQGQTKMFRLSLKGGTAILARASMGSDIASNGGLDVNLNENEISKLVATFNAQLKEKSGNEH